MSTVLGLGAVLALVCATGYFVAAEFSFVAVRRGRLEELAAGGDRRAVRALAVHRRLSFMLSGAQLGITLTTLILGFVAEPVLARLIEPALQWTPLSERASYGVAVALSLILATTGSMVLGELAPKNLAIAEPEELSLRLARITYLYMRVAGPVIRLFDGASNALLRLFGITVVDELHGGVSPDELEFIIDDASRGGALDEGTARLLRRSLEFRSLRAGDAMVSRNHVDHVDVDASGADLRALALDTGHSRFPVTKDDLDNVVGLVSINDLLRLPPQSRSSTSVRALLKPIVAVPESTPLAPLLGDMRESHSQLVVVIDEYGGTAGIVTLEDVVEELVGDIEDEYDPDEPKLERLDDGCFLVPGAWRIDEATRDTGVDLPEGEYDTVGGLIMATLGRVPEAGDVITLDGVTLAVERMDGLAVEVVRVTPVQGRES
jgi:CBS domain containing-hemolysin-like protein